MHIYYDPRFVLPLPPEHRFPMQKYALLHEHVQRHLEPGATLQEPESATDADLLLAHDAGYIAAVDTGTLPLAEQRRIGFPWSPELGERERLVVGATIAAGRAALRSGRGINIAGGTHHAFRDHGGGYCVFNDVAVAARVLQREHLIRRAVIIDCDVHQGDGTAAILAGDATIFTFSIHGAKNYPFHKQQSDLDIALDDGADDTIYLAALADGLRRAIAAAHADLALYVAGADPYEGDRLGRMAVTKEGLAARDRMVFESCDRAGLPVAVTMAGGYSRDVADTVAIHAATVAAAGGQQRVKGGR